MEAHEAYRAGNIDTALLKYAMLAELGYEVAQSNVAYILDHGEFVQPCINFSYEVVLLPPCLFCCLLCVPCSLALLLPRGLPLHEE